MPFIEQRGVKFHVQKLGELASPPLVMLHGLFVGSLASWYFSAAPRLSERYRVMLYDMRGHGLSSKATTGYDVGSLVEDLEALLPEAGPGRVTLVGHSYGAVTALQFALKHPSKVAQLVLVDAPLPPGRLPELSELLDGDPRDKLAALPRVLQQQVARGGRQASRLARQLQFLALESSLLEDLKAEPDVSDEALKTLNLPIHLLYGEASSCVPAGKRLAQQLPNARLQLLPGGHFLPTESAPVLTEHLLQVLHG